MKPCTLNDSTVAALLTSTPDICVGVKEITNVSTAGCDVLIWQYQIGNWGLGGRNFIFQKNKNWIMHEFHFFWLPKMISRWGVEKAFSFQKQYYHCPIMMACNGAITQMEMAPFGGNLIKEISQHLNCRARSCDHAFHFDTHSGSSEEDN